MTPPPWAQAVAEAVDGERVSLAEAVADEIEYLWADLNSAIYAAFRGGWSMECDWLTARIVVLSLQAGPTPWGSVPIPLLLEGIYQGIYDSAGIVYDQPEMSQVRQTWDATAAG